MIATEDMVMISIPRSALTLIEHPRAVSQRTSLAVLGLPSRDYLAVVREYATSGGSVLRAGKLRICEIAPLLAWLRTRRAAARVAAAEPVRDAVDVLAAELGLASVRPIRSARGRR